jgi:hypothetical protein
MWYNPNTGAVETNTFDSGSGAGNRGILTVNRTPSGGYAGSGTKRASVKGPLNQQVVADYDASRNVIYQRSGSTVRVNNATTGQVIRTFGLSGLGNVQQYTVGYLESLDRLVALDFSNRQARTFDATTGMFQGSTQLLGLSSPDSTYGMAYENGLLWVHDRGRNAWAGFDITDGDDETEMPPVPLPAGFPLLLAGLGAFAGLRAVRTT